MAAADPVAPTAATSGLGSPGLGDPFFPFAGNGGYDVKDYEIVGAWDPATDRLEATAEITARATQDLTRFNLDLRELTVTKVEVNDREAAFVREGQELIITPARAVHRGARMAIEVAYHGTPPVVTDPDGSSEGWMPTAKGGVVALGEPQGSPAWFPANDHPTDKATLSLELTVPTNLVVVSNGVPGRTRQRGDRATYRWVQSKPMATYLATVSIGELAMTTTRTTGGLPLISAVDPDMAEAAAPVLARMPEMLDWLSSMLGRYPFESGGAIVVHAPDVGYALETQDRATFTSVPDDLTMVHELAHQWLGNSVSVAAWPEMWLNEGFAGYFEWLWTEHDGGLTAQQTFDEALASFPAGNPFWTLPIGPSTLPGAESLFAFPVYQRGAMALHTLRTLIGDQAFFEILRTWATENRYGNVSTARFIDLAERVSGQQLDPFFADWLDTPMRPSV